MIAFFLLFLGGLHYGNSDNIDRFNYRTTSGTDFGPEDWNQVTCDKTGECSGWPDSWELGVGWDLGNRNNCVFCPADRNNDDNKACDMHRQSPINLEREPSNTGHDTECYDYHWMAYQDGSCNWHDIIKNGYSRDMNNFKIERHALQILQPIDDTGTLQCDGPSGRNFARLDYSKGFPDWWFLSHTEVTVPSEHTQHGKRYDAEVHLSHFYSVEHERKIGKVAIFLQADKDHGRWDFLDKLICQWREVEEETRDECGKESVPPYPGCRNPTRKADESNLENSDPYPFIDCDSVTNSQRICKSTSCCEAERSTSRYCQNEVYAKYGEEMTGSICWWCCPGKILAPDPTTIGFGGESNMLVNNTSVLAITPTSSPTIMPTSTPTHMLSSKVTNAPNLMPPSTPTIIPSSKMTTAPTSKPVTTPLLYPAPSIPFKTNGKRDKHNKQKVQRPQKTKPPKNAPTLRPTFLPKAPVLTQAPTLTPGQAPMQETIPSLILETELLIRCSELENHDTISMNRICKDDGCCESVRAATQDCHYAYTYFGENMENVCSACCQKEIGPPPPTHEIFPSIDCSKVDNPFRICKASSCCDEERSNSSYCKDIYKKYGFVMGSICWYCCSEPKEVDQSILEESSFMNADFSTSNFPAISLGISPPSTIEIIDNEKSKIPTFVLTERESEIISEGSNASNPNEFCGNGKIGNGVCEDTNLCCSSFGWCGKTSAYCEGDESNVEAQPKLALSDIHIEETTLEGKKVTSDARLRNGVRFGELNMNPSNFVEKKNAESEHLAAIENQKEQEKKSSGKLRKLNKMQGDNYMDVKYSPYQWLREVKTEYYYRYEGSQMVPPCFETVHYRVMKDPIRIDPIQLAELERLLAWRIAPKSSKLNACSQDTAGREREGKGKNAVDLNRPIQQYHNIHRKVFCECKDWKSKWLEDQKWCELDESERKENPYNFDSKGKY